MSKESLEHLRDYIHLTLSPSDIQWLARELMILPDMQNQPTPYTMEEINDMIDEGEREIKNGEYYSHEQMMDMLAEELGLSDEEYLAVKNHEQVGLKLEEAV